MARRKIMIGLVFTIVSVAVLQVLAVRLSPLGGGMPPPSGELGCACNGVSSAVWQNWIIGSVVGLFAIGWIVGLVYLMTTLIKTRRFTARPRCGVFTHGFIRPQISVCSHCADQLPNAGLQAMISHEKHHVARRDPLKFLILDTLKWALFYVPFVAALVKLYRTAVEIEADEQVTDRQALGGALLSVASAHYSPLGGGAPPPSGETIAVANFATVISERIERLVNPHWSLRFRLSGAQIMLSVVFMAGIFGILSLSQKAPIQAGVCLRAQSQCTMRKPWFDRAPAVQYTISL